MYLSLKEDYPYQMFSSDHSFQVESVYERGSSPMNEDRLLVEGNLFGVFDGATSLGKAEGLNGMTGGAMAAELARRTFLLSDSGLHAAMCEANREIGQAQADAQGEVGNRHQLWSTSGAVVQAGEDHIDYCQIGDSLVMFLYEDGSHRIATPAVDQDRETMILWKNLIAENGGAPGLIYDELQEQIQKVRHQMNRSYGVLNGEAEALGFIRSGREPLEGITDILLFTDGLFLPKENPEERSDWQEFASLYRQGGLSAVHETVRQMQASDPDCVLYPRFKCHDDIAAVAVNLS